MKFHVISDLHLEFGSLEDLFRKMPIDRPNATLLLAGDIGLFEKVETIRAFIEEMSLIYDNVVMIAGNHEFYHYDMADEKGAVDILLEGLDNVFYLQNDFLKIQDVNIIGSTFWSYIPPDEEFRIANSMNDYNLIKSSGNLISPTFTNKLHSISSGFVFSALNDLIGEKTIVMTHHSPTGIVHPDYEGQHTNCAYTTDYQNEIELLAPKVWIHGHTHKSMDYMVGDTRIICNPYGYFNYENNKEFNPIMEFIV